VAVGGPDTDWVAVRRLVRHHLGAPGWLDPAAAHEIMTAAGITMADAVLAHGRTEVEAAAARLGRGGPVVLKAVVPGLIHKTEAGAVRLGVDPTTGAGAVYDDFARRFERLEAVLVQSQVPAGPELLVGARFDPSAGPLVVVAAGGIEAELLADRVVRAAPLEGTQAHDMVLSLRTAARLTGFRGRPRVDLTAVTDVINRVSTLIATAPEIAEFEINPLVASPAGAVAVDVRIRLGTDIVTVAPLRGT
jgi:acyl-CoA synthetase (NDP forming)